MRLYYNRSHTRAEIMSEARLLGVSRRFTTLQVSVRREGDTWHWGKGTHAKATSGRRETVKFSALGGTLCHCLVQDLGHPHSYLGASMQAHALNMVIFSLGLKDILSQYQAAPTQAVYTAADSLVSTSPSRRRNPLEELERSGQYMWVPEWVEALAHEVRTLRVFPLAEALKGSKSSERARRAALAKFFATTWLSHLPKGAVDQTDHLLGVATDKKFEHLGGPELREVLEKSCVHRHSPRHGVTTVFFQVPTYVCERLMLALRSTGPDVQVAPWDEALVLPEVADLWTPLTPGALSSLRLACDAARLV